MSNIFIAFPNRSDGATLSGGSWSGSLPLVNLQDRLLRKFARSTNTATSSTKFDIDFGVDRTIRLVSLINHNLSLTAKYRVRAFNNGAHTTELYNSGWIDVWPSLFVPAELEWEDINFWDGKLTDEDRSGFTPNIIHIMDNQLARYWQIEIDDSAPANPDGYVQIGRLFMAGQWQPARNFGMRAALGIKSRTNVKTSDGGINYYRKRKAPRTYVFDLPAMVSNEAFTRAFDLLRLADVYSEILIVPDPEDELNKLRRSFLCRMETLSTIEQKAHNLHSTSFALEEII